MKIISRPVRFTFGVLLVTLVMLFAGCTSGTVNTQRVLWPPPPNQSHLEWVGTYASLAQMPKSSLEQITKSILGENTDPVFNRPIGIASDGTGKVFVSDAGNRQITVYDMNSKTVSPYSRSNAVRSPLGLALDKESRLYVADGGSRTVLVFGPDQVPLRTFGSPQVFGKPVGIAIDEARNRVYVSDGTEHRIVVFDMQGQHIKSFGQLGPQEGNFYSPQGLAVDRDGNLYVADMLNARVQIFDADGQFKKSFGERGDREWNFEMPKDIAIDSEGNLHITDARKGALLTYSADGSPLLFTGGGRSSHPLDLLLPAGIWVDKDDRIYVVDQLNRRFVIWQYLSADYLQKHPLD